METKVYWVYVLLCEQNKLYTGYTNNLEERYHSHVTGSGRCKFTHSFRPINIAQSWEIKGDRALAMRVERYIKSLKREQKEALIQRPELLHEVMDLGFGTSTP